MKIVLAFDSFKNSLSAFEVVNTVENAINKVMPKSEVIKVPLADGGENTLDILDYFLNVKKVEVETVDEKLNPINTYFGIYKRSVIIESAKIIGLKKNPENILENTSFGVGLTIKAALKENINKIYLTLGGSSTNDAGLGLLSALNTKFYNKNKQLINPKIKNFKEIKYIDVSETIKLIKDREIIILSDVSNPFIGDNGATRTYAKQKGASKKEIDYLEKALLHLNNIYTKDFNKDLNQIQGSGAAGGISGSLYALLNLEIKSGIGEILNLINFDDLIKDADLVVCGEGSIDQQSTYNKVISGVSKHTKKHNIKTIALAGSLNLSHKQLQGINIAAAFGSVNKVTTLDDALINAKDNLYETALNVFSLIKTAQ